VQGRPPVLVQARLLLVPLPAQVLQPTPLERWQLVHLLPVLPLLRLLLALPP
jgi:hypothetical protein